MEKEQNKGWRKLCDYIVRYIIVSGVLVKKRWMQSISDFVLYSSLFETKTYKWKKE